MSANIRRIDELPSANTISLNDTLVLWQSGRARITTVADLLDSLVPDPLAVTASQAALIAILDSLPALPADESLYPAGGGLFRNGDATGYSLTRIYPKV